MSKIKKILALTFILSCFSLISCDYIDWVDSDWTFNNENYSNFDKIYHFEKHKKYFDIDFKKDVFKNGELINQLGEHKNIDDLYNTVEVSNDCELTGREYFLQYEHLTLFKIRIYPKTDWYGKKNKLPNFPLYFRFFNTKKKIVSNVMKLGYFAFKNASIDNVHIKSIDDFKKVKENSFVYLDNDLDFAGKTYINNKTLFPKKFTGVFVNPNNHILKNLSFETASSGEHYLFSQSLHQTWFDNIIIDQIKYRNYIGPGEIKKESREIENCASFFSEYSNESLFTNIKIFNITMHGNEEYLSIFPNFATYTDYINCDISGKITNIYENKENKKIIPSTAGISYSDHMIIPFQTRYDYYEDRYNRDYGKVEQSRIDFLNFYKTLPLGSVIQNNKVNLDITSTNGPVAGYFNYINRYDAIESNNTMEGKLQGTQVNQFYNDSYQKELETPFKKD